MSERAERPLPDDTSTEPTIGQLVAAISRDISDLVSKEIELLKSELKVSVTAGGIGIAAFLGAAFLGLLGVILLSVTAAYFINWDGHGLALKWSFLIVTGFWFFLALLLVFVGIRTIKKVKAPTKAIAQAQAIPQAFKR